MVVIIAYSVYLSYCSAVHKSDESGTPTAVLMIQKNIQTSLSVWKEYEMFTCKQFME